MMLVPALLVLVLGPMLIEARRSARHDRWLRAAGAVEPSGDVYAAMQVAYPLAFLLPIAEAYARHRSITLVTVAGFTVFILAKALKYWAIATLGRRWTFRVLVPPSSERTVAGPYRVLRHPNYVAVFGELLAIALMAQAPVAGPLAIAGFTTLMLMRIRVEERALGLRRG
jgi:methyltransferase